MELIKFICWLLLCVSTITTGLAIYDNYTEDSIFKMRPIINERMNRIVTEFNNRSFLYRLYYYIKTNI